MNKNTDITATQLSIWLGIPASILAIMGILHHLSKKAKNGVRP
jgi:hypothetical protein